MLSLSSTNSTAAYANVRLSFQESIVHLREVAAYSIAPAVLGKCLAASLLCLVWWRLYNKLR